jgi:hypothetical protein
MLLDWLFDGEMWSEIFVCKPEYLQETGLKLSGTYHLILLSLSVLR